MRSVTLSLLFSLVAAKDVYADPTCQVIAGDSSWPANSVWRQAMPEVERVTATGTKKHPNWRLDAVKVEEVVAAVKFASQNKIRFSVLNSGHDFHGRNDAPNGLALVVTGLKGVRVLPSFTPTLQGVEPVNSTTVTNVLPPQSSQAYVTFGVGFSTQQLNNEIAKSNVFTLGAAHSEVTVAGGWGQTAGHSPLSPRYGLGADQVVEYKVVTADGQLRVANAVSNPDLFWALRGGGGGTFGVVVEATIKAHISPKVSISQFWINATDFNDQKSIYPAVAWLHANWPEWADKGVSSYYYVYPNAISLFNMNSGAEGNAKWHDENFRPFLEKMGTFPGVSNKTMSYSSAEFPNYKTFFDAIWGPIDGPMPGMAPAAPAVAPMPGMVMPKTSSTKAVVAPIRRAEKYAHVRSFFRRHGPGEAMTATKSKGIAPLDSWLLGAEDLKSPKFAQVLEDAMPKLKDGQMRGQFIGGGKVLTLGNDTSVLPAWRKTITHIVLTGIGQPDATAFRKHAPTMGAYANEASYLTPDWKQAFWGSQYDRLSQIKKQYDPEHLFWVTPGINAEDWTVKDGRLCRHISAHVDLPNSKTPEIAPPTDNPNFVDQEKEDETRGSQFPWQMTPAGPKLTPAKGAPPAAAAAPPAAGKSS